MEKDKAQEALLYKLVREVVDLLDNNPSLLEDAPSAQNLYHAAKAFI